MWILIRINVTIIIYVCVCVLCDQVVHAASIGDRATVLSKSKDLKFLTGFEAKVRVFQPALLLLLLMLIHF